MRDDLKLYVRGFFGSMNMSTETYQGSRSRPILSVFDLNPEALKHVVCNQSVVEVYNALIRRQVISTDFDFRERVVKIALNAFGVKNFETWMALQAESPTFTQLHADFITDTARFIATGKRNLPVSTWERLIGPGSNDPTDKIQFDHSVLQMLPTGYSLRNQAQTDANLPNVIAKWLSQSGGFTDLVTTLYTLFGEHNTK
jgi:hypothetical protein